MPWIYNGGMVLANTAINGGEELANDDLATSTSNIHIMVHFSIFSRRRHAINKDFTFCVVLMDGYKNKSFYTDLFLSIVVLKIGPDRLVQSKTGHSPVPIHIKKLNYIFNEANSG